MGARDKAAGSRIRAVLFDFDGTLTRPDAIDFAILRDRLGCPKGIAILEFIQGLGTEDARRDAWRLLEDFELAAARASVPNEGAEELIGLLRTRKVPRGILSRNSTSSIREAMKNFRRISLGDFPVVLSRENPGRPKPHPGRCARCGATSRRRSRGASGGRRFRLRHRGRAGGRGYPRPFSPTAGQRHRRAGARLYHRHPGGGRESPGALRAVASDRRRPPLEDGPGRGPSSVLFSHDRDDHGPTPRLHVALEKKELLPGSQHGLAVGDGDA